MSDTNPTDVVVEHELTFVRGERSVRGRLSIGMPSSTRPSSHRSSPATTRRRRHSPRYDTTSTLPATAHDSHCPVQRASQHTPSAQMPDAHSASLLHAAPWNSAHASLASFAGGIAPHTPSAPEPFRAVVHAWQTPTHTASQQTPSTQNPEPQSLATLQDVLFDAAATDTSLPGPVTPATATNGVTIKDWRDVVWAYTWASYTKIPESAPHHPPGVPFATPSGTIKVQLEVDGESRVIGLYLDRGGCD